MRLNIIKPDGEYFTAGDIKEGDEFQVRFVGGKVYLISKQLANSIRQKNDAPQTIKNKEPYDEWF